MLKELQKALGITPKADAAPTPVETLEIKLSTEDIQAAVAQAVESLRAEFDEFKQTAEAMVAQAGEEVATLTSQLEAANSLIVQYREAAAKAEAEAKAAKQAARKEKVIAQIGTERADALLLATEGMDDAAFDAVAVALGVAATNEAESPMFNEQGVDATADAVATTESAEMRILKNKYGKK